MARDEPDAPQQRFGTSQNTLSEGTTSATQRGLRRRRGPKRLKKKRLKSKLRPKKKRSAKAPKRSPQHSLGYGPEPYDPDKYVSPFAKRPATRRIPHDQIAHLKRYRNPRDKYFVKYPIPPSYIADVRIDKYERSVKELLTSRLELASVPKSFFYKKLARPVDLIGTLANNKQKVTCRTFKRHLWKAFINVNREKLRYCYRVHDSLRQMDVEGMRQSFGTMLAKLVEMMKIKRGWYCAICDHDRQRLIDHRTRTVSFNEGFCGRFLGQNRELIYFMNVILVEYMDMMLQLVQCYRQNGKVFDFPFRTQLEVAKRRIFFVQRCLATPEGSPDFLKHCLFMCRQFSYTKFTPLFDGDINTLSRVLTLVFQYLRETRTVPYIKLPPYQFVTPYEYPASEGSKLEESRRYQNDSDAFRAEQRAKRPAWNAETAMFRPNTEERLRAKVNSLQYSIFYKKKHQDRSIGDSVAFNKRLHKKLYEERLKAQFPPDHLTYLLKRANYAKEARKIRHKIRRMSRRRFRSRDEWRMYQSEKKIIDLVQREYLFAKQTVDRAAKERRRKAQLARRKRKSRKGGKRRTRQGRRGDDNDDNGERDEDRDKQDETRSQSKKKTAKDAKSKKNQKKENALQRSLRKSLEQVRADTDTDAATLASIEALKNDAQYYDLGSKQPGTAEADSVDETISQRILTEKPKKRRKKATRKHARASKSRRRRSKKGFVFYKKKSTHPKSGKASFKKVKMRVISFPRRKGLGKRRKKKKKGPGLSHRKTKRLDFSPSESQHVLHGIYDKQDVLRDVRTYQSMFLSQLRGLDPIQDSEAMDIDFDLEKLILEDYRLKNPEKIDQKVVLEYLGIPNQAIRHFNSDMDLRSKDYARLHSKTEKRNRSALRRRKRHREIEGRKRGNAGIMMRQNVLPRRHQRAQEHALGLDEFDPKQSNDRETQFLYYLMDNHGKYPAF